MCVEMRLSCREQAECQRFGSLQPRARNSCERKHNEHTAGPRQDPLPPGAVAFWNSGLLTQWVLSSLLTSPSSKAIWGSSGESPAGQSLPLRSSHLCTIGPRQGREAAGSTRCLSPGSGNGGTTSWGRGTEHFPHRPCHPDGHFEGEAGKASLSYQERGQKPSVGDKRPKGRVLFQISGLTGKSSKASWRLVARPAWEPRD